MAFEVRRDLTRPEWAAAFRAARLCRKGQRPHPPVNWLAKIYATTILEPHP